MCSDFWTCTPYSGEGRTLEVGDRIKIAVIGRWRNLIEALDRGDRLSSLATTQHAEHLEQPISRDVSVARRPAGPGRPPPDAGSRRDQAGDGRLGAAGEWEDLAVACVGCAARPTFVASRSCPSTATNRMRSGSGPRSWTRSAARHARSILRRSLRRPLRLTPTSWSTRSVSELAEQSRTGRADHRRSPRAEVG